MSHKSIKGHHSVKKLQNLSQSGSQEIKYNFLKEKSFLFPQTCKTDQ